MKRSKIVFLFLLSTYSLLLSASPQEKGFADSDTIITKEKKQSYNVPSSVNLPLTFMNVKENRIDDKNGVLNVVWERFLEMKKDSLDLSCDSIIQSDTFRIIHVGDSHVRGHIFPQTAGDKLREAFRLISYEDIGINGATFVTFTNIEFITQLVSLKPDLLIFSFGTNESHSRKYNAWMHRSQMDTFITLLRSQLPHVPILITTPPGSYDSHLQRIKNKKRRRSVYTINPRTEVAAKTLSEYASEHNLALWDLYNIGGGKQRACKNWTTSRLMRPDHVHYLPEGYILQGNLLGDAMIKAYNNYVSDKH